MPIINFVNEKKQVQVPEGTNLRKAALDAGVELYSFPHNWVNCRGFSVCASCRVLIKKGGENVSEMGMLETGRLKYVPDPQAMAYIGNEKEMRLACQTVVNGDVDVETKPPLNLFGESFFS
ncbi:MAG: (2Fe-2S)-binding protein [Planctomycetales bacterium]